MRARFPGEERALCFEQTPESVSTGCCRSLIQRLLNTAQWLRRTKFYGVLSVNWLGDMRPVVDDAASRLARARSLIEKKDFASAVPDLEAVLEQDLAPELRCEVQANLAATLCILARDGASEQALARLDKARLLLIDTLQHHDPLKAPREWASARANMALVYLARYMHTDSNNDILHAHLALDGTEDALNRVNDTELMEWTKTVRDHLLDLRDRRGKRR